jgi:hypothetical protein
MAERDRTSSEPQDAQQELHGTPDENSDRRGRGGYGDSSGFEGAGTRAATDDDEALPQHQELQNRPDSGMRGRSTSRSQDEGTR